MDVRAEFFETHVEELTFLIMLAKIGFLAWGIHMEVCALEQGTNSNTKRYFIIDQQIAWHFVQYS